MDEHAIEVDSDDDEPTHPMILDPSSSPILGSGSRVTYENPILAQAFRDEYYRSHNPNSRFGALVSASSEAHPWLDLSHMVSYRLLGESVNSS